MFAERFSFGRMVKHVKYRRLFPKGTRGTERFDFDMRIRKLIGEVLRCLRLNASIFCGKVIRPCAKFEFHFV